MPPLSPEARATQDVAKELARLNKTLETMNSNFATFLRLLTKEVAPDAEAQYFTTKPTPAPGGYFDGPQPG